MEYEEVVTKYRAFVVENDEFHLRAACKHIKFGNFLDYDKARAFFKPIRPEDNLAELLRQAAFFGNVNYFLFAESVVNEDRFKAALNAPCFSSFRSPLADAIMMSQEKTVAFLLDRGANPLLDLADQRTPMHYALSRKTFRRAQTYSNVCQGDPITILQMLLNFLPEETDLEARLKSHGNHQSLELDLSLLDIALDRDDTRARELLEQVPAMIDSDQEVEQGEEHGVAEDFETQKNETTSTKPRCDVCKTSFQTPSHLTTHLKSRKHMNKAKKFRDQRDLLNTAQSNRRGLSMTGFHKLQQEASNLICTLPNEILLAISGFLRRSDISSLTETCQFFRRLLQRRILWKTIDFTQYSGFMDEETIRRVAKAHYASATELVTWSDAQNVQKQQGSNTPPDPRFGYGYQVNEWMPMYIKPAPTTVFEIPTLTRQLRKLDVRFADVTMSWISKTLRNNPQLEHLTVHYGLYVPGNDSSPSPVDSVSFPGVKSLTCRTAVRDVPFIKLAEDDPSGWTPMSPLKESWIQERTEQQDDAFRKFLLCFPNLQELNLVSVGSFSSTAAIRKLVFPAGLRRVTLKGKTIDNGLELSELLSGLARCCGESIISITIKHTKIGRDDDPVDGSHLSHLASFPNLTDLNLYFSEMSNASLHHLSSVSRNLTSLKIVATRANQALQALSPHIHHLTSLKDLTIKNVIGYFELKLCEQSLQRIRPIESQLPKLENFFCTATIHPDLSKPLDSQLVLLDKMKALALNRTEDDLTWTWFKPQLIHLNHLTFLDIDLHFPNNDTYALESPSFGYILNSIPYLEKLHVRGCLLESSFFEPFYHDRLRSLFISVNRADAWTSDPPNLVSDFSLEQLAYSLPALKELCFYWIHDFSRSILLEMASGFPNLKDLGARSVSSNMSRLRSDISDAKVPLPKTAFAYPPY